MKENSILRTEAFASLQGHWATSVLYTFVYFLAIVVLGGIASGIADIGGNSGIVGGNFLNMLLTLPFIYGYAIGFLHQFRGEEQQVEMLFSGFKLHIWCTMILAYIYVALWSLLLIVPGIMKYYSYAMTPFILNDEPELTSNAAIEKSMAMMQGYKMKLFLLDLSFIGWYILGILTFGIALLWVTPYAQSARSAFYEDLKNQNI